MPLKIMLTLGDSDLEHFRQVMRKAREAADDLDDDAIIRAASELVARVSQTAVPEFVEDRLGKLKTLIDMVTDERWQLPETVRRRTLVALAYFSNPEDLIPDEIPGLGFLDDAIMIELVVRELRHEIEAFEDFVSFGRVDKEAEAGARDAVVVERDFQERRRRLRSRIRRRERRDRASRSRRVSLF